MGLNQNDLKIRVKKFVTNGKHPDCQSLLGSIGYDEARLTAGESLLDSWLEAKASVQRLREAQKSATKAERGAERNAQLEATALREAVRALWMNDESVLAQFDLVNYRRASSRAQTNGASNGNGSSSAGEPAANGSGWVSDYQLGTPERIARWRVLFATIGKLDEAKQTKLAEFGWDADHVAHAVSLVENYAQADAAQQSKIKVVSEQQTVAKEAEKELRRWYAHQASRLTRSAIKRRVPEDRQEYMRDLLGL